MFKTPKFVYRIESWIWVIGTKLMGSNRGWPKIRSKSYLNRLLINFFDPDLPVQSIVAMISIRIWTEINRKLKTVDLYQKFVDFIKNWWNLSLNCLFSIK